MKTLTLENIWSDDNKLRRVFSWLSRIGAAPKFGSRPIGCYQQHQCKAIEYIERNVPMKAELRCRDGQIQWRTVEAASLAGTPCTITSKWNPLFTAFHLFNEIDSACRKA